MLQVEMSFPKDALHQVHKPHQIIRQWLPNQDFHQVGNVIGTMKGKPSESRVIAQQPRFHPQCSKVGRINTLLQVLVKIDSLAVK